MANLITLSEKQYYEGVDTNQLTGDDSQYGNYQFLKIGDIVSDVIAIYCQKGRMLEGIRKGDVNYPAHRALQELSFDTFRSIRSMEIEIPPSLVMALPIDYVGYTKVVWKDSSGIEHTLMPAIVTSNPTAYTQDSNYYLTFDTPSGDATHPSDSNTWFDYHGNTANSTNPADPDADGSYDIFELDDGKRYGGEPRHMNANGSFFIDQVKGRVHFSSNCTGKTVTLKYISDGLGYAQVDDNMFSKGVLERKNDYIVHKFAQEAMIKWVVYGCLQSKENADPNMLGLLKKEKFAETRKAKIRLSEIKLEEITQILRGKSKWIKH